MGSESNSISYLKNHYEGCGHSKAEDLLHVFRSVERLERADVEEITQIDGVGEKLAIRIANGETKDPEKVEYSIPDDLDIGSLQKELIKKESDEEILSLLDRVINDVCPSGKKQEKIAVLIHVFGRDPGVYRIAKATDAHKVYVRRFVWDEKEGQVKLQNNAAKRRVEQVDMVRRKEILDDYGACVGCGEFRNRLSQCKIHHVQPVDDKGAAEEENVVPLCPSCHSEVHDTGGHGEVIYSTPEEFWNWAELELD
ncbi:HNH endonuclease (plasmid) [Halorutilales archaeon Cl-col2-1]